MADKLSDEAVFGPPREVEERDISVRKIVEARKRAEAAEAQLKMQAQMQAQMQVQMQAQAQMQAEMQVWALVRALTLVLALMLALMLALVQAENEKLRSSLVDAITYAEAWKKRAEAYT